MNVRKAVIAVAGYGTRFLPATKVIPKEMMAVVDRPIIQYLVEEAVASGIEEIILVNREGGGAVADHFGSSRALEGHLAAQGKTELLERIRRVPRLANFATVRQNATLPYGNAAPILAARHFLRDEEPFVYMFGDDLVASRVPCVRQLIDLYTKHRPAAIIAVQEVPQAETRLYGIARLKANTQPPELESIVEKPPPGVAPSLLAQLGRFVLTSEVVRRLAEAKVAPGEELYLTPTIDAVARDGRVLVHQIDGVWYTTGDPLRFMMANVEYTLRHPDYGPAFGEYLQKVCREMASGRAEGSE